MSPSAIAELMDLASKGDLQAADRLLPEVYSELRALAKSRLAQVPPGNTFQPTALVHEAYLKLLGSSEGQGAVVGGPAWKSKAHFFGAAARAMRDILVDQARRKSAVRHGGGARPAPLDPNEPELAQLAPPHPDMLALDEAIRELEREYPRPAQVVMLRFFAGLTHEQIASAMALSVPTIDRDWRFARSWLQDRLTQDGQAVPAEPADTDGPGHLPPDPPVGAE